MNLTTVDLAVLRLYNEPHRSYHTVFHVLEMLELHETGQTRGIEIPRYIKPLWSGMRQTNLISAIVAHDCVYEIGREKGWNERTSFESWRRLAGDVHPTDLAQVEMLILSTINHDMTDAPEAFDAATGLDSAMAMHLIDLDMSVLGATREEFDRNSANIMAEFLEPGLITLGDYEAGRRGFFARTLAQPRIFFTEQFHAALELRARENMIRDLGATWPIPDVWRTGA